MFINSSNSNDHFEYERKQLKNKIKNKFLNEKISTSLPSFKLIKIFANNDNRMIIQINHFSILCSFIFIIL